MYAAERGGLGRVEAFSTRVPPPFPRRTSMFQHLGLDLVRSLARGRLGHQYCHSEEQDGSYIDTDFALLLRTAPNDYPT
jgi:hypothetical protein